ncbi:MAG: hypothetical protein F6K47_32290 [Symploca sp. SIO2E6]|nr:hypothetical protein [Symploca sp. SIO2E6]
MDFDAWNEAIATRLAPIRDGLNNIPVAALPNEAGKFGNDQFESIDWLFPEYSASPSDTGDTVQEITVTLVVRLYFQRRRTDNPDIFKAALEWAEQQILIILPGFRLPDTFSPLRLVSGRLFAPSKGQWYKEINFSFTTQLVPSDEIKPMPLVTAVEVDDKFGDLVEVS